MGDLSAPVALQPATGHPGVSMAARKPAALAAGAQDKARQNTAEQSASVISRQYVEDRAPRWPSIPADMRVDEKTLAGPPPAFEISLLELDRELRETMARLSAEMAFGKPAKQPDPEDAPVETRDSQQLDDATRAKETDAKQLGETPPTRPKGEATPNPQPAPPTPVETSSIQAGGATIEVERPLSLGETS